MEREIIYLTPNQAGGQASNATDPNKPRGVHYSERLGRDTMSLSERVQASNATDPNKPRGVHYSERLERDTTSLSERGQAGGQASLATDPNKPRGVHYSERLERDTTSLSERSKKGHSARTKESRRKANLKQRENGGWGLNPNADRDFIIHCDRAKEIIAEVRFGCEYCLFNQLY
jgi:hypothetical protein